MLSGLFGHATQADAHSVHKKLTVWARQMIKQLRRWLPDRESVMVGDNSYAVLDLLHACQTLSNPVALIARLRLDAALYEPAPPYPGRSPSREGNAFADFTISV